MGAKSIFVVAGVGIATLLYLVYLGATYEPPEGTTTIVVPPPASRPVQPATQQPAPIQRTTPAIGPDLEEPAETPAVELVETPAPEPAETVTEAEPGPEPVAEEIETEVVQLPSLGESDSFIGERLLQLRNGATLLSYLVDEQMIRRFVVLVDNISQGNLPQTNLPYQEVAADFPVRTIDDNLFELDEAGYRRFDQVVDAVIATDTEQVMMIYRLASPLFQQAYAELGYRDVNFDDTLRRAVRNVLGTDEIEGPFQLVKPSVMYLFADSEIEGMSDIQKQLIRIGPDNREKIKAKLRQVLQQL